MSLLTDHAAYCLHRLFRLTLSVVLLIAAPAAFGWSITSRELVDIEYNVDETLTILVSTPSVTVPGIYRWQTGETQPSLVCRIASPAFFSFDRKVIIERVRGEVSWLRVYNPSNCRLIARVKVKGYALDADVRGAAITTVVRDAADRSITLRLYSRRSKVLASAAIGRNVEMGFAPDGRSVVNFDLSDAGARMWRLPRLAKTDMPGWTNDGEMTFVPGSAFVKRYLGDALHVARWPAGTSLNAIPAARSVRLRQLSRDGRIGVLHERKDNQDVLDWADFAAGRRISLAQGSVDNAALHPSGQLTAWTVRGDDAAGNPDRVTIHRARVGTDGVVVRSLE